MFQNEISVKSKHLYIKKLSEILENVDATWQYQKSNTKSVIDLIVVGSEKLCIFWNAWKRCAIEIEDDSQFTKYTGYFINDLLYSSIEFKKSIEDELFELISSSKPAICERAKVLYSLLR